MADRTLADYLDVAEQAAGNQLDDRIERDLINDAGEYLFAMHQWPWARRDDYRIKLVAGQPWVDLPDDFQQWISASAVDRLTHAVHATSLDHIDNLRGGIAVTGVTDWYVALEYPGQPNHTTNAQGARLAIYPEPTSDDSGSEIRLRYRAGWVPLTDMDQVANIPRGMEMLLIQLVRAFTHGYMREQAGKGSVAQQLEAIEQSAMVDRLKRRYGTDQTNYGELRGGIVRKPGEPRHYWRTDTITVTTTN